MAKVHDAIMHRHGPGGEGYAARPHPEYVAIDIGGGFGALIVHARPELHGIEVEISAVGHDEERQHKEVLERSMNGRAAFTAVFDKLAEGDYALWVDGKKRARGIAVRGGEIAELDWTAPGWDSA
jgi:hypothetical protein